MWSSHERSPSRTAFLAILAAGILVCGQEASNVVRAADATAQPVRLTSSIRGIVQDEQGGALGFVQVSSADHAAPALSDSSGYFEIRLLSSTDHTRTILHFSKAGYSPKSITISISDSEPLTIQMDRDDRPAGGSIPTSFQPAQGILNQNFRPFGYVSGLLKRSSTQIQLRAEHAANAMPFDSSVPMYYKNVSLQCKIDSIVVNTMILTCDGNVAALD